MYPLRSVQIGPFAVLPVGRLSTFPSVRSGSLHSHKTDLQVLENVGSSKEAHRNEGTGGVTRHPPWRMDLCSPMPCRPFRCGCRSNCSATFLSPIPSSNARPISLSRTKAQDWPPIDHLLLRTAFGLRASQRDLPRKPLNLVSNVVGYFGLIRLGPYRVTRSWNEDSTESVFPLATHTLRR